VYSETAKQIFAVDEVTPEQREAAKKVTLAVLYGMGVATLAAQLKVGRDEAKRIFDGFWLAYPVLKAYTDGLKKSTGVSHLTTTLSRPIAAVAPGKSYRAPNSRVQGEASDVLQVRAVAVADVLGQSALWLQLHDELIVEVTPERVPEALAALELMLTPFEGVPMTGVPTVLGPRWTKG
jgi:DNA polymerase-1